MEKITLGILAHVDAGKTTLSEGILYLTGTTRKMGRVDKKDTFLDNDSMERDRGITVFSKEARFNVGEKEFTLVDTPGHADFSAEMERTLTVLDYAILVVSGVEGIQSHTLTLIKLFDLYDIPCFIFVNKLDMPGASYESTLKELKDHLHNVVDMTGVRESADGRLPDAQAEEAASCSETLMEEYFSEGFLKISSVVDAIKSRELFPVIGGSALKMEGVQELLDLIGLMAEQSPYPEEFGAKVYKITRDSRGNRLTHLKVTGGTLRNKMLVETSYDQDDEEGPSSEKIEQIRLYNGEKFTTASEVPSGTVCAVLGPVRTFGGQGLGYEAGSGTGKPFIEPALIYTLILPDEEDPVPALQKMKELEEEDPTLRVSWEERTKEIKVSVMGELEKDLLKYKISDRFGLDVEFGKGRVIYRETITAPVEGIGHYEPLRHYAEVRLLLEPLPEGSGLVFESLVPEDELKRNWQRLILKHLRERRHKGTQLGCEITDMKISLIAGRAHLKHTEGGDFRQATYRAVRQGLRRALDEGKVRILEPMYDFNVRIPQKHIGRVMTDMDRLGATCRIGEQVPGTDLVIINGRGPISTLSEYQMELNSFSEGMGRFDAIPAGYGACHDPEAVIEKTGYDCDTDVYNPCGSVFTDHGAGVYVEWNMVDDIAHTEGGLRGLTASAEDVHGDIDKAGETSFGRSKGTSDDKTLKAIFEKT